MKIPAVAIAAAFVGGILLGLNPALSQIPPSRAKTGDLVICCIITLLLGFVFRLQSDGIRILRTDQSGATQIRTDGHNLRINCFVACPPESTTADNTHVPDNHQPEQ